MTVKELKRKLEIYPDDMKVAVFVDMGDDAFYEMDGKVLPGAIGKGIDEMGETDWLYLDSDDGEKVCVVAISP